MNELDWQVACDFVIEAVEDFERGADERLSVEAHVNDGSDDYDYFRGKSDAFGEVLSWLRSKKQARRLDSTTIDRL